MHREKPVNVNTALIGLLIAIGGWQGNRLFNKVDANSETLQTVVAGQRFLSDKVEGLEKKIGDLVLKSDFQSEVFRLRAEIDGLKKKATDDFRDQHMKKPE